MLRRVAWSTAWLPLVVALRTLGTIDMFAFIALLMPASWIQLGHQFAGLGDFPDAPIAGYLARSASALYGLHGVLVFYISFQVVRYWRLIRLMATLALLHGFAMLGIDLLEGMPLWWTLVEGPAFAFSGAVVLLTQYVSIARTRSSTALSDHSPRPRWRQAQR